MRTNTFYYYVISYINLALRKFSSLNFVGMILAYWLIDISIDIMLRITIYYHKLFICLFILNHITIVYKAVHLLQYNFYYLSRRNRFLLGHKENPILARNISYHCNKLWQHLSSSFILVICNNYRLYYIIVVANNNTEKKNYSDGNVHIL